MPSSMLAHHAVVAAVVAEHGGGRLPPDQGEGDSRLAVFPTAAAAVAAAGSLQQALSSLDWPGGVRLSVRMGVHTGTVVEADGNVFGRTVHRCARLRALAHGDQVLVTGVAAASAAEHLAPGCRLTRLGRAPLRDFDDDEDVFQLDWPGGPTSSPRCAPRCGCPRTSRRSSGADARCPTSRRPSRPPTGHAHRHRRQRQDAPLGAGGPARVGRLPRWRHLRRPLGGDSAVAAYESVLAALDIGGSEQRRAPRSGAREQPAGARQPRAGPRRDGVRVGRPRRDVGGRAGDEVVAPRSECRGRRVRPVAPLSDVDAVTLLARARDRGRAGARAGAAAAPTARRPARRRTAGDRARRGAVARARSRISLADALRVDPVRCSPTRSAVTPGPPPRGGCASRHRRLAAQPPDTVGGARGAGRWPRPGAAARSIDVARLDAVTALDTLQDLVAEASLTSSRRARGAPAFTVLEPYAASRWTAPAGHVAELRYVIDGWSSMARPVTPAAVPAVARRLRAAMSAAAGDATTRRAVPDGCVALGRVALAQGLGGNSDHRTARAVLVGGRRAQRLAAALLRRAGRRGRRPARRRCLEWPRPGTSTRCALGAAIGRSDPVRRTTGNWLP